MLLVLSLLCSVTWTTTADNGNVAFPSTLWHGEVSARKVPSGDRVEFPGLTDLDEENTRHSDEGQEIPRDILMRLNSVQNISELQDIIINGDSDEDSDSILLEIDTRFGVDDDSVERKASAVMAEPATCTPRPTVIQLQHSKDKRYVYYPSCTTVNLCGGCCLELMECQPMLTETVYFKVLRYGYQNNKLVRKAREVVPVEQHLSCECGCKVQEKHCNKTIHEYRPETCECVCTNIDEKKKCEAENYTKLWNPSTCSCMCLKKELCSTGRVFNERTCSCVAERRRRVSEENSRQSSWRKDKNTMSNIVPRTVNPL